jgi:sodium/hydrogen exchanger-like protein 3
MTVRVHNISDKIDRAVMCLWLLQVLYHMFDSYTEMGPNNILYTDVLAGFASFFVVALGGTIIGILWGFLTGLVTRYTHQVRVIEPIFIFVMAYLAYLNAEIFRLSGIMS